MAVKPKMDIGPKHFDALQGQSNTGITALAQDASNLKVLVTEIIKITRLVSK